MRARWLRVVAIALLASPARGFEVTTLPAPSGTGIERGVAVVRCTTPSKGVLWSSRAAILDTAAATADVLLTTAHGLPAEDKAVLRDCRVLVRGKAQSVAAVWRGGDRANPEADWAVILTKRIAGDVHRWRAAHAPEDWLANAVAVQAPVRLVLRFADAAESDCRLEPRTADPQRLLAHSCVTYPGTSGSPLVIGVEHEPVLIGIHIGTLLQFDGRELDFVSVARPIDAAIGAAIESAVAATAAGPPARRRARP